MRAGWRWPTLRLSLPPDDSRNSASSEPICACGGSACDIGLARRLRSCRARTKKTERTSTPTYPSRGSCRCFTKSFADRLEQFVMVNRLLKESYCSRGQRLLLVIGGVAPGNYDHRDTSGFINPAQPIHDQEAI